MPAICCSSPAADQPCSLPAAIAMFGLSLGVANIDQALPSIAYALLSGLNAAIVGVIALATVELSNKAITDGLTRLLVFFTASAGMLYSSLWYFPVLMAASGFATLVYDFRWLHRPVGTVVRLVTFWRSRRLASESTAAVESETQLGVVRDEQQVGSPAGDMIRSRPAARELDSELPTMEQGDTAMTTEDRPRVIPQALRIGITWRIGVAIIVSFFASFLAVMILRGILPSPPRLYSLFANMFLAGTIIFGGGPVVIPLLREYVVAEGWVSQRDFLIGLAIIQACPGPNFNFAVFLGSLTAVNAGQNSVAGAAVAWLGIFFPGMVLVHGTMGVWNALRSRRSVKSVLRGINAGAVGLIYTAVYRIWQVGYVDETSQQGRSLGDDPWWLVVAATSFVFGRWYNVSPPVTIIAGAVMGLIRYGIVSG